MEQKTKNTPMDRFFHQMGKEKKLFLESIFGSLLIFIGILARVIAPIMEFLHGSTFWDAEVDFQTGQRILTTGIFYDPEKMWLSPYPPLPLFIFALFVFLSGKNLLLFVLYFRLIEIGSTILCYSIICHYLEEKLKQRIIWGLYLTSFPALWLVRELRPSSYLFFTLVLLGIYFIGVRSQIRGGFVLISISAGIKWFSLPVLLLLPFWNQWQRRSRHTKIEDIFIIFGFLLLLLGAPVVFFPHYLSIYNSHLSKGVLSDELNFLIRVTSFLLLVITGIIVLIREKEMGVVELVIIGLAASVIPISISGPGRQYLRLMLPLFPIAYSALSQRYEILLCPSLHRERSIFHQEAMKLDRFSTVDYPKWERLNLMANTVYLAIGIIVLTIFVICQHQRSEQRNHIGLCLLGILFIFLTIVGDIPLLSIIELIKP